MNEKIKSRGVGDEKGFFKSFAPLLAVSALFPAVYLYGAFTPSNPSTSRRQGELRPGAHSPSVMQVQPDCSPSPTATPGGA